MTQVLSLQQIEDLLDLTAVARDFGAEIVMIGAMALISLQSSLDTYTSDVDLVVALDLSDFAMLIHRMTHKGWIQEPKREHRWRGPRGSIIDLVPAGPQLRAAKQVVWPDSDFVMSLACFDHVFAHAVAVEFARGVKFAVAPVPVVAMLKIAAHVEDPHRRAKDLGHLKSLFRVYASETDRIFGDDVFAADLEDIEFANSFLLGSDLRTIATAADHAILDQFFAMYLEDGLEKLDPIDDLDARRFQRQLRAFAKGLGSSPA